MDVVSIYDLSCCLINGQTISLNAFQGDVLLIVNTASYCGFTSQYGSLERLYRDYRSRGFSVLAFPSNDFYEEPRSNEHIHDFCLRNYQVTFPVFAKVSVNGPRQHELFRLLKAQAPRGWFSRAIKWNFTKFLVNRDGKVVGRYGPLTLPGRLRGAVESLLDSSANRTACV